MLKRLKVEVVNPAVLDMSVVGPWCDDGSRKVVSIKTIEKDRFQMSTNVCIFNNNRPDHNALQYAKAFAIAPEAFSLVQDAVEFLAHYCSGEEAERLLERMEELIARCVVEEL